MFPYQTCSILPCVDEDSEQLNPGVDRGGFGPTPFDESSTGDCILQTSDGVQYKAHRILLALASPVFRDMWEVGTEDGNIPVVEVTESNDVVHNLLLHLYPATTPSINNFTLAFGLMDACEKYLIDTKSFFPHLAKIFRGRTVGASEADALDAYCLAWRLGMRERAQESSRHLYGLDLTRPSLLHEIDWKAGDVRAIMAL
ncbi:hypothetical protein FRC04_008191 [Tulasnella sp. 424]|nr:hypothetical protein FRC04_008191 [Tulasnella sp. 424]